MIVIVSKMSVEKKMKKIRLFKRLFIPIILIATSIIAVSGCVFVLAAETPEAPAEGAEWRGLAILGAGIAVTGSCLGAGLGLWGIGKSGPPAMVERPELAVWILILAGLAEGVAIYGLLVAIMILGKI